MTWRYIAERVNGDGTATQIHGDVPLADVSITKTLSGPDRITGVIKGKQPSLIGRDGQSLLQQWSTAFYAVDDSDAIRAGGILAAPAVRGQDHDIDCIGFAGYPQGMPYNDSWYGVQVDPLDVVRRIWDHLQTQRRGNIGVEVDATTSPIRIGDELEVVSFTTGLGEGVSFEAGPVKLNWWTDTDLGKTIDDLARDTPFDYWEEHFFDAAGKIRHRLRLAYPGRGRRRTDLRFVVGENVSTVPDLVPYADEYANEVIALGAGEGRDMIHTTLPGDDGRIRRVAVVTDKTAKSNKAIADFARSELVVRQGLLEVEEIAVWQHPNAPVGSWDEGDEINIRGDLPWGELDIWRRIVATTITPENPEVAVISLARTAGAS